MNKKQLQVAIDGLVSRIQEAHGSDESVGRTLLGLWLNRNAALVVAGTNPPAPAKTEEPDDVINLADAA